MAVRIVMMMWMILLHESLLIFIIMFFFEDDSAPVRTAFSSSRPFWALETFYIAAILADFFLISALTCIRINGKTGRRENGLYIKPKLSTLTLCAHSLRFVARSIAPLLHHLPARAYGLVGVVVVPSVLVPTSFLGASCTVTPRVKSLTKVLLALPVAVSMPMRSLVLSGV